MNKTKNIRKNSFKNNRGAISILVIVTILSFMAILMGSLITVMSLRHSQQESNIRIQEIYMNDYNRVDEIYNEITQKKYICRIGEIYYFSIADAINEVPDDGTLTTIILLKDTDLSVTVSENKNIVLDLAEYTLKGNIINYGTLKIEGDGIITSTSSENPTIQNQENGKLELVDVTIENKDSNGYAIYNLGYIIIREKKITGKTYGIINVVADGSWNGTVNTPKIDGTGLTAVYWNDTQWVALTASSSQEEWNKWYDYSNQKWANAVSSDGSMWVWIPRYEYKIDSTDNSIDVRFISKSVKSGTTGYETDSSGIITSSDGYIIHPAFINDTVNTWSNGGWDSELPGFWVAKYAAGFQNSTVGEETKEVQYSTLKYTEIGSFTSNFLTESLSTDTNISYPVFKANTYAYNIISIGDAYLLSKEISKASMYGLRNVDSHLQKNSEWGAVAYLTHSKYGINGNTSNLNEVTQNAKNLNNSVYVNNAENGTKANVYAVTSYGDSDIPNDVNASSTKNMTGVFDLSGYTVQRMAAFFKGGAASNTSYHNAMANSDTTLSTKYVTLYTANDKKGDATNETSTWNNDTANFIWSGKPIIYRGNPVNSNSINPGIFTFYCSIGDAYYDSGFRVCLAF